MSNPGRAQPGEWVSLTETLWVLTLGASYKFARTRRAMLYVGSNFWNIDRLKHLVSAATYS
jgi:hypothetical protein